jgi:TRAP-type C4-dicarboxylate transport system permease small subunit
MERILWLMGIIPEIALGITVSVMIVMIFTQVIFRYIFNAPIYWADEFAVLIFAWMIFLGAVIATKNNDHISVDTFMRMLPERYRSGVSVVTNSLILLVLIPLFTEGIRLTYKTKGLLYPAMEISRAFLYISLPVTVPLMGLYFVRIIITDLRHLVKKSENN